MTEHVDYVQHVVNMKVSVHLHGISRHSILYQDVCCDMTLNYIMYSIKTSDMYCTSKLPHQWFLDLHTKTHCSY